MSNGDSELFGTSEDDAPELDHTDDAENGAHHVRPTHGTNADGPQPTRLRTCNANRKPCDGYERPEERKNFRERSSRRCLARTLSVYAGWKTCGRLEDHPPCSTTTRLGKKPRVWIPQLIPATNGRGILPRIWPSSSTGKAGLLPVDGHV